MMTRTADNSFTVVSASAGCYLVPNGTEEVENSYLMGKPVKIVFSNEGIIPAFTEVPMKNEKK